MDFFEKKEKLKMNIKWNASYIFISVIFHVHYTHFFHLRNYSFNCWNLVFLTFNFCYFVLIKFLEHFRFSDDYYKSIYFQSNFHGLFSSFLFFNSLFNLWLHFHKNCRLKLIEMINLLIEWWNESAGRMMDFERLRWWKIAFLYSFLWFWLWITENLRIFF